MPWGMGRNRGDRDETEKEVYGSATPKVVSAWSYDGGGGATTPLMLSHPLSRRSTTHGRACTRRSDEGTEKNVQSSREQATGDEERKRGKACSRVYGQWLTRQ
ncbi:hypothetical protein K0M31_016773 [Melipona bicolor]|uniref:Uncharacterized protein n=1 Tax=Melipona bicolor TaxID=60889 RepID=A0AA40FEK3_9HYME|nr:hypothetical protein K0M31_016773 [Melipona bicolor]